VTFFYNGGLCSIECAPILPNDPSPIVCPIALATLTKNGAIPKLKKTTCCTGLSPVCVFPGADDLARFSRLIKDDLGTAKELAMPWILLLAAGGLEVIWAIGLKEIHGFLPLIPSLATVIALFISFALVGWAIWHLPVGIAYAVWVGLGILGVALVTLFWIDEGMNPLEIGCMMAITGGIIGLKFMSSA
jgi:quaternary ammonium compound-resistance protein SugE